MGLGLSTKFKEIFKSWVISFDPTPEQKKLAEERLQVCEGCEHKEYEKHLDYYYCGLCTCPLKKKVFTPAGPEACPGHKWKN